MLRIALGVAAASLLLVPAARAAPVALLDAPHAEDIALAGSEVIVPRTGARGRLTVDAVSVSGGPTRRLLSASGPGKGWGASAQVSASERQVAVAVFYDKPNLRLGDAVKWRLYTGPISGPLRLASSSGRNGWHPIDTAVEGERVFVDEGKFTLFGTRLRLFEPGAAPRVLPWGSGLDAPIAIAGDHLAFPGSTKQGADAPLNRVFVADPLTGAKQVSMAVKDPGELDVAADGRVVADYFQRPRHARAGNGAAQAPGQQAAVQAAFRRRRRRGGRSAPASSARSAPSVLDPGATAARPVGVPTGDITRSPPTTQGVAWIGNGCVLFAPTGEQPRRPSRRRGPVRAPRSRSTPSITPCTGAACACWRRASPHRRPAAPARDAALPRRRGTRSFDAASGAARSSRSGCRSGRPGSSVSG